MSHRHRLAAALLMSLLSIATTRIACAGEMTIEETIESRKAGLHDIGGAFKGIRDELKKGAANGFLIRQYANQIRDLSQSMAYWFPPGSGPESGVKTLAKPAIWQKPMEFVKVRDDFISEAGKFSSVAREGNLDTIKLHFKALGQLCASCHDTFRTEEK